MTNETKHYRFERCDDCGGTDFEYTGTLIWNVVTQTHESDDGTDQLPWCRECKEYPNTTLVSATIRPEDLTAWLTAINYEGPEELRGTLTNSNGEKDDKPN